MTKLVKRDFVVTVTTEENCATRDILRRLQDALDSYEGGLRPEEHILVKTVVKRANHNAVAAVDRKRRKKGRSDAEVKAEVEKLTLANRLAQAIIGYVEVRVSYDLAYHGHNHHKNFARPEFEGVKIEQDGLFDAIKEVLT